MYLAENKPLFCPLLLEQAQRYTEDFAAVKGIFEGLYIAAPVTCVLTHTSQGAVGITTRSGDSLKTFQDTILAQPRLTNLDIMKSPGTGSMILSMYDPIFDGGRAGSLWLWNRLLGGWET